MARSGDPCDAAVIIVAIGERTGIGGLVSAAAGRPIADSGHARVDEGRRVVHGISSDPVVVPTAAERSGDFSATPFDPSAVVGTDTFASILNARCRAKARYITQANSSSNTKPSVQIAGHLCNIYKVKIL